MGNTVVNIDYLYLGVLNKFPGLPVAQSHAVIKIEVRCVTLVGIADQATAFAVHLLS